MAQTLQLEFPTERPLVLDEPREDGGSAAPRQWPRVPVGRLSLPDAARPAPRQWPPAPVGMSLPDAASAVNVVDEYRAQGKLLPQHMAQWIAEYDWHRIALSVGVPHWDKETRAGVKGAPSFGIDIRLASGGGATASRVEDVGPVSTWVAKDYKFEQTIEVEVKTASIVDALKLVGISAPLPDITSSSKFTYVWQPQVQTVSATTDDAGHGAEWQFNRSKNKWLDGTNYELVLLIRRRRDVRNIDIEVESAWVKYDVHLSPSTTATGVNVIKIPVEFKESKPEVAL